MCCVALRCATPHHTAPRYSANSSLLGKIPIDCQKLHAKWNAQGIENCREQICLFELEL